jgi:hypothetical protein
MGLISEELSQRVLIITTPGNAPGFSLSFHPSNSQVLSATRDRFSFPTGRSGFWQKAALIIFPEAMRHLPTAATRLSKNAIFRSSRGNEAQISLENHLFRASLRRLLLL